MADEDEPIVSEGLFYLALGEVPPHMAVNRSGEIWAKKFKGIVAEGRFPSRPLPKRLGTSLPPPGFFSLIPTIHRHPS